MTRFSRPAGIALALACGLTLTAAGCTKQGQSEGEEEKSEKPVAAADVAAAQKEPAIKASEDDCVGPLVRSGKPQKIAFENWEFKLDGYLLTQLNGDPDEEIVVGVVSDTKENTEANRKNLDKIIDFFERNEVELIVHLGDIASTTPMPEEIEVPETDEAGKPLTAEERDRKRRRLINKARRESMKQSFDDIVEMLSVLAETELPLLVIGGNRECKTVFNSALTTLSEDYPNVFNMNIIRRADLDDLDVISMPGYHDPEYVHCPWDKCLYYPSDTLSLVELAEEANSEKLLISHGPPRQNHRDGIDVVSEGANVGNRALTEAIRKGDIFFGAFGNIQEAGGKAVNLSGDNIIPQDTFVRSLYLNPGPADSMIWTMNDGTDSQGMAGVLHFVGNKAKYKIYRIGDSETPAQAAPAEDEPAGEPAPKQAAEAAPAEDEAGSDSSSE